MRTYHCARALTLFVPTVICTASPKCAVIIAMSYSKPALALCLPALTPHSFPRFVLAAHWPPDTIVHDAVRLLNEISQTRIA